MSRLKSKDNDKNRTKENTNEIDHIELPSIHLVNLICIS